MDIFEKKFTANEKTLITKLLQKLLREAKNFYQTLV
jgi:hypothetical protein